MQRTLKLLAVAAIVCGGAGLDAGALESATPLRAFATSTTGTGNLHTWNEVAATNLSGLAAADGICRARATAAGLADPQTYVAWLSDRDNDAYCRLFGLTGKKVNSCNLLLGLPTHAGPWLRTDGVPFADFIENALDANVVYSTLNVDEFGNHFVNAAESFTATDIDGTFDTHFGVNPDCDHWTSAVESSNTPSLGSNTSAAGDWTFDGHGASCNTNQRLNCLQSDSGSALRGHGSVGRREAFVTAANVDGNIGGLTGADGVCQAAAASAGLFQPQSFKALLISAPLTNIADRFEFDGPWYRRDGLLFAHDKAELTGGAVTLPLNVTESGAYVGIAVGLTGARADGTPSGLNCSNWLHANTAQASGALVNSIAFSPSNGTDWLSPANVSCTATPQPTDWSRKLFCLSDSDVIFHDAFAAPPAAP